MKTQTKTEQVNVKISPCCGSKTSLSARFMGRETWRCTKCNKLTVYKYETKNKTNAPNSRIVSGV